MLTFEIHSAVVKALYMLFIKMIGSGKKPPPTDGSSIQSEPFEFAANFTIPVLGNNSFWLIWFKFFKFYLACSFHMNYGFLTKKKNPNYLFFYLQPHHCKVCENRSYNARKDLYRHIRKEHPFEGMHLGKV